jgi:hypothetical protein
MFDPEYQKNGDESYKMVRKDTSMMKDSQEEDSSAVESHYGYAKTFGNDCRKMTKSRALKMMTMTPSIKEGLKVSWELQLRINIYDCRLLEWNDF